MTTKPSAMQRRRDRLKRAGWVAVTIQLTPVAADELMRLQRDGASQSECVEFALALATDQVARVSRGWRGEVPIEAGERREVTP